MSTSEPLFYWHVLMFSRLRVYKSAEYDNLCNVFLEIVRLVTFP